MCLGSKKAYTPTAGSQIMSFTTAMSQKLILSQLDFVTKGK
jgi:hypothetical protein